MKHTELQRVKVSKGKRGCSRYLPRSDLLEMSAAALRLFPAVHLNNPPFSQRVIMKRLSGLHHNV